MKITGDHLGYGRPSLKKFLEPHGVTEVLFIPYAWPNMRDGVDTQAATKMYKESVIPAFKSVGCDCKLIDTSLRINRLQKLTVLRQSICAVEILSGLRVSYINQV